MRLMTLLLSLAIICFTHSFSKAAPMLSAGAQRAYPQHVLKGSVDISRGHSRFVDDITLWHPGGPTATFHFSLAPHLKFRSVRWRDTDLECQRQGNKIVVPLPYNSGPSAMKISVRYEGPCELLGETAVLGQGRSFLPIIEGDQGSLSIRLKVSQGAEVVASVAPITRAQGADGSLLCRFPTMDRQTKMTIVMGNFTVDSIYSAGARIEVVAHDAALAQRAAGLVGRIVQGLAFTVPKDKSKNSFTCLLLPEKSLATLSGKGLAVIQSKDEYLTPTTEEICRGAARLVWSSLDWTEDEPSQILLSGLVDYSATALLARRSSSPRFTRKLEHVIKTVRTTRPVPKWRRWRGKSVPQSERGFGFCYMLRGMVGNEGFSTLLRTFVKAAFKKGYASSDLLLEVLQKELPKPPKWLFSSYLASGFLPDFLVQEVAIAEQQRPVELLYDTYGKPSDTGRYISDIRVVQNGELRYAGKVGLRIQTDIEKLDTTIDVEGRVAQVQVITSRPPRKIIVDPNGKLIEANVKNNTLDVKVKRGRF